MTDQGHLFTITYNQEPTTQPDTPTCPSCRLRPAHWNQRTHEYSRYCGRTNCNNHQRKCNICSNTYDRDTPGAGRKYCSEECKRAGYAAGYGPTNGRLNIKCRFCDNLTGSPFAVCKPCTREIIWAGALRRHHAPEWVWEHMTTLGTCMNLGCQQDISGTYKRPDTGAYVTLVHVDHDHTCCEHTTSCGKCIRGVLCQGCNQALGMLRNNYIIINGLAAYQARHD